MFCDQAMIAFKLLAVPLVVWLASQAGRRFGHRVAGLIGGFPLIAGPIMLFLAFDAPRELVVETSWLIMAGSPAVAAHCVIYAWLARVCEGPWQWIACLLCAWAGCVAVAWVLTGWAIIGLTGYVLALGLGLLLACLMPKARTPAALAPIPGTEIAVRMAAALVLAAAAMFGAETFGPRVSGVLLVFPITASVLPVFTLALHGADATARLLSGFALGLLGFTTYFFVFASLLARSGPGMAFVAGALASVAAVSLVLGWQRLRSGRGN